LTFGTGATASRVIFINLLTEDEDSDDARHALTENSDGALPEDSSNNASSDDLGDTPDDYPDDVLLKSYDDIIPQAEDIYTYASRLQDYYNNCSYPSDLLVSSVFNEGVRFLCQPKFSVADLLGYYHDVNMLVACMAVEALARRTDKDADLLGALLSGLNSVQYWTRYFALRALNALIEQPIISKVLLRLDYSWTDYVTQSYLQEFIAQRVARGEAPDLGEFPADLPEAQVDTLASIVATLKDQLPDPFVSEIYNWKNKRVDIDYLKSFGRIWGTERSAAEPEVVELGPVLEHVALMEAAARKDPPRSVMLVGASGVGKTALIRVLARRLQRERWTIFEATATDIMAGQKYTGELEGRVQTLVRHLSGKKVLWVVPNFHELLWAGRHNQSPVGILEMLLPYIERGEVRLIGETHDAAYENLIQLKPKLRTALETCRVLPLGDAETMELARKWVGQHDQNKRTSLVSDQTLQEAFQLARQYLGDKAAPGNLLHLLEVTYQRLQVGGKASVHQIFLDDLLVSLSQLTGLPISILDDRQSLDLKALREFFQKRVLGQPEAVECLIERVAMIKAGLTDPTRPQGVFLFVGPTGTGKTEIAKTLAEFLFGSPDRMIRLDMSELMTAEALDRILGENSQMAESAALVNQIRKQPFSVVLLDEFEKANPSVWDLFLQVFDDGRLTDRRGNTSDFRHCILIMTSNLGATLPHGLSIGFMQDHSQALDGDGFAAWNVERAVAQTFRREFVNRIDRVVVFRPLGRSVMRELLHKELTDVLRRRGLRNRAWAVEWDESAVDFLLQKGFTADLGARPLKRAVERYLLSPLAVTIVNHQFPEGDQFLFVRSDGERINVSFIDPDKLDQDESDAPSTHAGEEGAPVLKEIVLDARGTHAEVAFLKNEYERLAELIGDPSWEERKQGLWSQTTAKGFWEAPQRFKIFGHFEYMERIETGLETAGALLQRLQQIARHAEDRKYFPRELVGRLAQQVYLVEAAHAGLLENAPQDAFLWIRACCDSLVEREACDEFARRVAGMYRAWAEKRGMRLALLEEKGGDGEQPFQALLAISGFASYAILEPEAGLHVKEIRQDQKSFRRLKVQVRVLAQPDEPPQQGQSALSQARKILAQSKDEAEPSVVRRYREEPSPLVRDSVRNWRTGKLDRVLGGDFDLMF
jgi:ATP-dependent Clp protease ATP-binding subunit ClpC